MPSSEWVVCPSCGQRFSDERAPRDQKEPALLTLDSTSSESMPAGAGAFSSSADFHPSGAGPDPFLEHLAQGELADVHFPEGEGRGPNLIPPDPRPPSFDGLDLGNLSLTPDPARPGPTRAAYDGDDDEVGEAAEPPRSNWPVVLLASYASALTLAMLWLVVLPRMRGGGGDRGVLPPQVDSRPDPGSRAENSRRVEPLAPIPEDRRTTLGKPLTVGSVEITPLDVEWREISLHRSRLSGGEVRRDEERRSLVLRLRLQNVSKDQAFAPFDEGFVREREGGMIDSFVLARDDARIDPFPLAVESDWSIEGQRFEVTNPGESFDTIFVVSPEGEEAIAPPLLWRIRLRTGIDRTDVIGVTTDAPAR